MAYQMNNHHNMPFFILLIFTLNISIYKYSFKESSEQKEPNHILNSELD